MRLQLLGTGLLFALAASAVPNKGDSKKNDSESKERADFAQIGFSLANGGTTGGKGGSTTTVASGPALVTAVAVSPSGLLACGAMLILPGPCTQSRVRQREPHDE
jgi:pectate lyase